MKRKLQSLLLGALVVCALSAAGQQNPVAPPPEPRGELAILKNRLALSADQQKQIRLILKDRRQTVAAIRNDASLSPKERASKTKEARMEADSKIRALLNDNQLNEYDNIKEEQREKQRQRRETTALPPQ